VSAQYRFSLDKMALTVLACTSLAHNGTVGGWFYSSFYSHPDCSYDEYSRVMK